MKLSQLTESFVISNDEFEDYLNRATEQLVSELSSGKNPRDAVHDLALTFADQHNKSYDAYQRMADSLEARMHTLEMNSPTDMGMGSVDEPEMMSDPMGSMEMNTPASSEMPSDSDMEDYAAVMDNEQEVEESYSPGDENAEGMVSNCCGAPVQDERNGTGRCSACGEGCEAVAEAVEEAVGDPDSVRNIDSILTSMNADHPGDIIADILHWCDAKNEDFNDLIRRGTDYYRDEKEMAGGMDESSMSDEEKEKAMKRAMQSADEPERGEERKKVSLKKAPWEESVDEGIKDTVKATGKKIGKATKKAKKFFGHGEHAAFDEFDDDEFDESVSESAIDTIRKIADEKSAMKIKFDNGTMMVDMFTASAVKSVYDNVNDANKEKLDNLMKTKEGMMKVANLSMKMLKEGRLDEYWFIPALIGGAARAVGAVAGAGRAAGAVAGAARAAGGLGKGLGKVAKVARAVSGAKTIAHAAGGLKNAYDDPTYKRATGKHLEHTDWRLEMKADDIMNSAIDKANKK